MQGWQTIIPPLVVLLLSFVTKKVNQALLSGIIVGAFIVSDYAPVAAISLAAKRIFAQVSDLDNLYLYGFLTILCLIIILMIYSGSTAAYGRTMKNIIRSARGAQIASLILSSIFFIDDYLSSLTVGSVMRRITDQFHIPRVKLSFLINMLAPAMAVCIPLSSWIAMILSQLNTAGISDVAADNPLIVADPFIVYVETIPYIFYSIIAVCSTWFIVVTGISYGPMRQQEKVATTTGNLFGGKELLKMVVKENNHSSAKLIDFVLPISVTLFIMPIAISYSGGFFLLGGSNDFLTSITSSNIFKALFFGSVIALATTVIFYALRRLITLSTLMTASRDAVLLIQSSLILLLLAATFSAFIRYDLPAGAYLANLVGSLSIWLLPFVFFFIAVITSLATGSAWGTIAVMAPLAVQMLISMIGLPTPLNTDQVLLLYPILGAVFSGAVAGTHLSPISDNCVISTTSVGSYLIDHIKAQTPYVLPPLLATGLAFFLVGFLINTATPGALLISLAIGLGVALASLTLLNVLTKKR